METTEILLSKIFTPGTSLFQKFDLKSFKEFLLTAVQNTYFIFNGDLYKQIDGLSMGNPLAPTLANVFLCELETKLLERCPIEFKPVLYKRYLDDTFCLFRNQNDSNQFLKYINEFHPNIHFTVEHEAGQKLPFLDVLVDRSKNCFATSIYRKPTFTGLGTNFFSYTPYKFKLNCIRTLIFRAYSLASDYVNFHLEVEFIKRFFQDNGYPVNLVDKLVGTFLDRIYNREPPMSTVEKQKVYVSFPYFGPSTLKLIEEFQRILADDLPHVNFIFSLKNTYSIASFFRFKDLVPANVRFNIIYKYTCDTCQASYIGSTQKQARVRYCQHAGISFRTLRPVNTSIASNIHSHCSDSDHMFKFENFSILDSASREKLRILESLYIKSEKPQLNSDQSSHPLYVS